MKVANTVKTGKVFCVNLLMCLQRVTIRNSKFLICSDLSSNGKTRESLETNYDAYISICTDRQAEIINWELFDSVHTKFVGGLMFTICHPCATLDV
jgi:hypothetical protein